MSLRGRAACWLLIASLAAGCASVTPPASPAAGSPPSEAGRPRVEVTTEPAPAPRAPVPPPDPPASPAAGAETAAAGPPPPESAVLPAPAPVAAAPETPTASAPVARPPSRQLVLNFDNADVEVVIQAAAEIVGFNYVLAPTVRGRKITVQTVGKISSDEVFAVLVTILDVNGLAAVRSGNLYRIIPREGAPQTPVKTIVGREVGAGLPPDEVVTQVVRCSSSTSRTRSRCFARSCPRRAPSPRTARRTCSSSPTPPPTSAAFSRCSSWWTWRSR